MSSPDDDKNKSLKNNTDAIRSMPTDELKRLVHELLTKHSEADQIFDNYLDAIKVIDINYNVVRVNNTLAKILKKNKNELIGKKCYEIFPCNHCTQCNQHKTSHCPVKKIIKEGKISNYNAEKQCMGLLIPHTLTVIPILDTEGKTVSIVEIYKDISEHSCACIEIQKTKERYRELFNNTSNGVVIYKTQDDGRTFLILDFNKASEKIENIKKEKIINCDVSKVFPGIKKYGLFNVLQRVYKTGVPEHFPISLYKDNRIKGWRENYVYKLPSDEVVAIYQDLTDKKKREEISNENITRLNQVVENTKDWIWEVDPTGLYTYSNDSIVDILGFTKEEIVGKKYFYDLFDPKSKEKFKKKAFQTFEKKIPFRNFENINISKNGEKVYISTSGTPILDDNYNLLGYRGLDSDITILKNNERILKQHRKSLQKLVESKTKKQKKEHYHLVKAQEIAHVGTWEINPKTNSIDWTKETYKIFGIPENTKITYKLFLNCIHPDDRAKVEHNWKEALQGKTYNIEHRLIVNGKIKWVRETSEIVSSQHKTATIIGTILDITQQKLEEEKRILLEKQLSFTQKMQAIGSLANGMAHEFNNIIGIIMGMSEILQNSKSLNSEEKARLEEIYNQGERAVEIITNMQKFTATDSAVYEPIQLDILLQNISNLLKMMFPKNISMIFNIEKNCPIIMGNPTNLQQIVLNICNNALHAMANKGGKLEIDLRKCSCDAKQSSALGVTPGEYLKMCITDNGHGMKPEVLDQIFNPFFSTKEVGKGIGLGLSIVSNIVKKHNGAIKITSTPSKGTHFCIYFPTIKSRIKKENKNTKKPLRGKEHILIVEDETSLSEVYKISLEKLGYSITIANSGSEALKIFKTNPNQFDVIFTDYIMPEMDGLKLSEEIYKIKKDMPLILATAYNNVILKKNTRQSNIRRILNKPVNTIELTHLIRGIFI